MLCPLKEYEIKTKMVQEQSTQLKKIYFVELNFDGKEYKFGGEWVNDQISCCWRGLPHPPSRENPVQTLPTSFHIQ